MKKALEAGIKYCENERQSTVGIGDGISRYICYVIERVLRKMLAAIDAEPEKPETQGSVDWGYLEPIIRFYMDDRKFEVLIKRLKKSQGQWLHTKPAIDFDEYIAVTKDKRDLESHLESLRLELEELKKAKVDPEIKRVYDEWKKNDGIVVIERAFEREMWNCIKAHCERGE